MSDTNTQAGGNTPSTASAQPVAGADSGAGAAASAPAVSASTTTQQAPAGQTAAPASAPAASSTSGDTGAATTGKPASVAPDRYEFKSPEGVPLDADTVGEFSTVAKELNLPQDAAQKVIDKLAPKLAAQNAKAINEAIKQANATWVEAVKVDTEFGGEKLNENLAVAKRGIERFASNEMRALLEPFDAKKNPKGMGLGNNPEVIRLFYRVGKAISEDKFVAGGTAPSKDRGVSAAERLYGQPTNQR
jgi:hypothetical protein